MERLREQLDRGGVGPVQILQHEQPGLAGGRTRREPREGRDPREGRETPKPLPQTRPSPGETNGAVRPVPVPAVRPVQSACAAAVVVALTKDTAWLGFLPAWLAPLVGPALDSANDTTVTQVLSALGVTDPQ